MAVGTSLGANRLACFLAENNGLTAACVVQAPMKLWVATEHARGGFYDKEMGKKMVELYKKHQEELGIKD